ncbi:MAG: hypothetical protein ACYCXW_01560 [Solirubrobacteraceae bacterium]
MVVLLQPPDASSLLSAAGALDEADRALLDLWCVRRLSDDRLEAMSGVRADRLRARRERICARLAQLHGVDSDQVSEALAALAAAAPANHPGSVLGPAAARISAPLPGMLLGPAAARMAAPRSGAFLGPAAARMAAGCADAASAAGHEPAQPTAVPAASTPAPRARSRRHRRAVGGAVAAVCLAIGIAAFASQRADARSASPRPVSAGSALAAPRPGSARPRI